MLIECMFGSTPPHASLPALKVSPTMQPHGITTRLIEWDRSGYIPDIVVLDTGLWNIIGLGSPEEFEASLHNLAKAFRAWHARLVRGLYQQA
jgi:hypothetical protein